MRLVPFTVSVKADPPAVAVVGLRLVVVGTGLVVTVPADLYATTIPSCTESEDGADQVIVLAVDAPGVDFIS